MPRLILPEPVFETAAGYAPPEHDPGPFASVAAGEIGGLTHFGARFETLPPDAGETAMQAGDCAAFPAGRADGHHLRNDGAAPATFLVAADVVARDTCVYSDVDLIAEDDGPRHWYSLRDGAIVKEF